VCMWEGEYGSLIDDGGHRCSALWLSAEPTFTMRVRTLGVGDGRLDVAAVRLFLAKRPLSE
jgi:hypothetical protein